MRLKNIIFSLVFLISLTPAWMYLISEGADLPSRSQTFDYDRYNPWYAPSLSGQPPQNGNEQIYKIITGSRELPLHFIAAGIISYFSAQGKSWAMTLISFSLCLALQMIAIYFIKPERLPAYKTTLINVLAPFLLFISGSIYHTASTHNVNCNNQVDSDTDDVKEIVNQYFDGNKEEFKCLQAKFSSILELFEDPAMIEQFKAALEANERYNEEGFNPFDLMHKDTRSVYGPDGYDMYGFDKDEYDRCGYNTRGYNREGINKYTGTPYDKNGLDVHNIYRDTGTEYSPSGFNRFGKDRDGFDSKGFDLDGFNREGLHRDTGREHAPNGFNKEGIHKDTGTEYSPDGHDEYGFSDDYDFYSYYSDDDVLDLVSSIKGGYIESLKEGVLGGKVDVDTYDYSNLDYVPLIINCFFAVCNSHDMVRFLIDNGANVEARDGRGNSLMFYIGERLKHTALDEEKREKWSELLRELQANRIKKNEKANENNN